jgi:serine/threonine protein phosphatase PrpC
MTQPSDRRFGCATHLGRNPARKTNQDRIKICDPVSSSCADALYLVCDGMGGHKAGEVASQVAVDEISRVYAELACQFSIPEILARAIREAHAAVRKRAADDALGDMGTTVVVAAVHDDELYVANVGDSRAYLLRDGVLSQVSRDHSRVAEMVRAGVLTPEEAKTSSVRNVITRAMSSMRAEVEPDFYRQEFREGDALVLCTDGLWGPVEDAEIQQAVATLSPQAAAETLVSMANEAGGPDNVSVIVARRGSMPTLVSPAAGPGGATATVRLPLPAAKSRRPLMLGLLVAALVLLVLAAAGVAVGAYLFLGGGIQFRPTATATYTTIPLAATVAPSPVPPTKTSTQMLTETATPPPPTDSPTPTVTGTATRTPSQTPRPLPTNTRQVPTVGASSQKTTLPPTSASAAPAATSTATPTGSPKP